MSNLHAPNSNDAKTIKEFPENLKSRKEVFFKSPFISNFPIMIIFATDNHYIETFNGEIGELFNVEFSEHKCISKTNKLWIHYSKPTHATPKLLIHTRQLTNGASNDLMEEIASIVSVFIKRHKIQIIENEDIIQAQS